MPPSSTPSYLRAAFLNVYNLSLLGGAVTAAAATGEWTLGVLAAGAEALWLIFGPDVKLFRRVVDRQHREEREAAERKRIEGLMQALPEREWARAHALDELRREIERDLQLNPSFQVMLLQTETEKLSQLFQSFVALATACIRAETYLSSTDKKDLQRQLETQDRISKMAADPAAGDIAKRNMQVLERRMTTIQEIEKFVSRARGQMSLMENSVRLLRDQVLTMASPDQLGEQLDDLIHGVEALQATAKAHEGVLSRISLEPLGVTPDESASRVGTKGAVR